MIVNAVYWSLGLEEKIPQDGTDVRIVGTFEPSDYGFGEHRPGVRPADHAMQAENAP